MALKVLDEVRIPFPDAKEFIEHLIDEECLKEEMRYFLNKSRSKELVKKKIVFILQYVKRYFMTLNSLIHNIYLRGM